MRKFSSLLLCLSLLASLSVCAFASGESPSGSAYSGLTSYNGSYMGNTNFWTALSNTTAGIWYKLGSTSQSGSILYLLQKIYDKIPSSSGGGSSPWTSSQASSVVSNTNKLPDILSRIGGSSTSDSITTLLQAIKTNTSNIQVSVDSNWSSTQVSNVVSNTSSMKSTLETIATHQNSWSSSDVDSILTYSGDLRNLFSTGTMNTYIEGIYNHTLDALSHYVNFQSSLNDINGVLGVTTDSYPLSIQAYSGMTYAKLGAVHNYLIHVQKLALDTIVSDFATANNYLHSIDSVVASHLPVIDTTTQSIDAEQKVFHSDMNDHYNEFFDYFSVSDNPLTLRLYGRTSPSGPVSIQSVTDNSMMLLARNSADDPSLSVNTISNDQLSFADRMTAINNNLAYLGTLVSTASTRYKFHVKNYDTGVSSSNSVVSLSDWLYFFNENLGDQVQRLGYIFGSDDDIAMKDSTKNDSQWVTDYYSGSDRAGVDDYSSVHSSVSAFNGFMSTGSSDNLGDGLAQIDDNGYSFWSSAVDQDINHSVGSGSTGKFSARSSSDCPVVIDFFNDNWRLMGVNENG